MDRIRRLAILLFDDVELLDFAGPFEVFSTANRQLESPAFELCTVAHSLKPIKTHNGLVVMPEATLTETGSVDLLLVPGGVGTRRELDNDELMQWIKDAAPAAELVMSVCTGALLLAKAGLLNGLTATTHRVGFSLLEELDPTVKLDRERRFVDNGRVVTSAGIAAGIDMSLHVVARLLGQEIAIATAAHMEYPYE